MNWSAFCIRGAFLGLLNVELETGAAGGGRTEPPRSTLGAAASDATLAAGLADDVCAVPCNACEGKNEFVIKVKKFN